MFQQPQPFLSTMIEVHIQSEIGIPSAIHAQIYKIAVVIVITTINITTVLMVAFYIDRNVVPMMIPAIVSMPSVMIMMTVFSLIISISVFRMSFVLPVIPIHFVMMPFAMMLFSVVIIGIRR